MRHAIVLLASLLGLPLWAQVPTIISVAPSSGKAGSPVTITGSGFSTTAGSNIVHFGGCAAKVNSASTTQLQVTVPSGATYGPVTVTTGRLTAASRLPFTVTQKSLTPLSASAFAQPIALPTGAMMRMGAIADLDGDGKLDLIGTNDNNYLSIFRNTATVGKMSASSFASELRVPTGIRPYSVAAGDLDGDGKIDLVVANNTDGTVSILHNTSEIGGIVFQSIGDLPCGGFPQGVAIADIDGDGKPDVIVSSQDGGIAVLRNQSVGDSLAFSSAVYFMPPNGCGGMAVADLDGDGLPDIVAANGYSTVSVFRNTSAPGNIAFAPSTDLTGPPSVYSIAIGDLNGDGKLDIVAGSNGENLVSAFRNTSATGTISFGPRVDYAPGSLSWNLALGDLYGNGMLDLVVPNTSVGTVSVFANASSADSIIFNPPLSFPTGGLSMSINIGDLDGDGLMDLVIGNFYQGNCLSVLQRNPSRTVQILVQPDSLAFGWVREGTSDTLVLTISNVGTTDTLHVSSIFPSKSVFVARPVALVIPPLGSRPISVIYSPNTPGKDSASLAIASDDTLNALWNVPLRGTAYALTDKPIIKAIVRVSYSDVRIVWLRSIFDSLGTADPVTQYSIWREVPPGAAPGITGHPGVPRPASLSAVDPLWEFIETVPAIELNQYAAVVPLSPPGVVVPAWCTFMVAAQSRSQQVYLSLPDSVQGDPVGDPTAVPREGTMQIPRVVVLNQNYPNPFNPSTVVEYGLPGRESVSLIVYNLLGQEVARLVDEIQNAGYYHVRFDGSHLASGVYFCRLRAGENVRTERILLVK